MQYTFFVLAAFFISFKLINAVPRWTACENTDGLPPSRTFLGGVSVANGVTYNDLNGMPVTVSACQTICDTYFPSHDFAVLSYDGVGVICQCGNIAPPANTLTVDDFLDCDGPCNGQEFYPCGSDSIPTIRTWYEPATNTGDAAIAIVMCYELTTQTELDACRRMRRATALYMGRSVNGSYTDIEFNDPCGDGNNGGCDEDASCDSNLSTGERICTCPAGLIANTSADLIPGIDCVDLDECASPDDNDCNTTFARCINTDGSFFCQCDVGYVDRSAAAGEDPGAVCVPVFDECYFATEPVCVALASCTNNAEPPGHTCTCPVGYEGDGLAGGVGCNDINECDNPDQCDSSNGDCINTIGSFRCICPEGRFLDVAEQCVVPYGTLDCQGNEAANFDRKIAFGPNCDVAVLFDCDDDNLEAEPNRTRIIAGDFGLYTTCVSNVLVDTFDPATISNFDEFINNGGKNILDARVECTVDSFSVRFSSAPANAVGFYLSDLFLGGVGDYDTVESMYKNEADCQGQFWVENGFQYRFQTTTNSNQCGTTHMQTDTQIIYSAVIRGRIGDAGPVISRAQNFEINFLCVTDRIDTATQPSPYLVFNLERKKRGIRSVKEIDVDGVQHALIMDLWDDSTFATVHEPAKTVQASQIVYTKIDVDNDYNYDNLFMARPLRCWQTLTPDGAGDRYKNIVSNGCNQNQWKVNGNVQIPSDEDHSFRFGFPVTSFDGGNEAVYVTCLVDIGYSSFAKRCENLITSESSFRADSYMAVITTGPIHVVDVCGGRKRGSCEHYCSVTEQQTVLCYCATGFNIDPNDPRKCVLPSEKPAPSSTTIYWYYYGVPIVVFVVLIMVICWVYFQNRKSASKSGAYDLKFTERDEIIVD